MKKILQSYINVAFPAICACCGTSTEEGRYICVWCRDTRFEPEGINSAGILPEIVEFQYSMWQFDKGGYLQDLLHKLKYHYLKQVGVDLGSILGTRFETTPIFKNLEKDSAEPLIVPVPLHPSKKRKRGFNQARALAEGLHQAAGWKIIPEGAIVRTRKTKTQTGLTTKQRAENLRGAFKILSPEDLKDHIPIIIDDVFTTGATTFELANCLAGLTGTKSGILTIAKA